MDPMSDLIKAEVKDLIVIFLLMDEFNVISEYSTSLIISNTSSPIV
jgi:hypothetical protein